MNPVFKNYFMEPVPNKRRYIYKFLPGDGCDHYISDWVKPT